MKYIRNFVLGLIVVLLLGTVGCGGQNGGTGKQANNSASNSKSTVTALDLQKSAYFVTVDWLKDNLNNVVLLDARKDTDYNKGHIPGAINATWQSFANMDGKPGQPNWGTLLPADKLAVKIGSLGIDGKKTVIVYADPSGWGEDGRVVWTLKMAGITDAKMLDGGWKAWKAVGGQITQEVPSPKPVQFTIKAMDENFNATTDWIIQNSSHIKIVDVRSEKEYQGATDFGEARGGHLPQAINLPFTKSFNSDGTIKSTDELKQIFTQAGLRPEDEIVTYCTKGIRSAHMALLLRMAGFTKTRNYDASFYEWAGNTSLPLEK
ncbi:sulfurtransferase [Neomoorella thermoacetica]|uniref:sulfurtransferase n=1 Tax=Neomoorella thermoacetica TaxID=1525 RepID=UPI0030D18137